MGLLTKRNVKKAIDYYQQAHKNGDNNAAFEIATLYRDSSGKNNNIAQAIVWFKIASKRGSGDAYIALANLYETGKGVAKDHGKAFTYTLLSHNQGNEKAALDIADTYLYGKIGTDGKVDIEKDFGEAAVWLERAIENGSAIAAYRLLQMIKKPEYGIKRDIAALRAKMLNECSSDSQFKVGKILFDSDPEFAINLFIRSVRHDPKKRGKYVNPLVIHLLSEITKNGTKPQYEICLNEFVKLLAKIHEIETKHYFDYKKPLAHFTGSSTISSILPLDKQIQNKNVLRLFNTDYMNDPMEGKRLGDYPSEDIDKPEETDESKRCSEADMKKAAETSKRIKRLFKYHQSADNKPVIDIPPAMYATAFTQDIDGLNLWRAYGQDGTGLCIVISPQMLKKYKPETGSQDHLNNGETDNMTEMPLFRVKYETSELVDTLALLHDPLNCLLAMTTKTGELNAFKNQVEEAVKSSLFRLLFLYKHKQYDTEQEVRAIRQLSLDDENIKLSEQTPGRLYCETSPILFKGEEAKIIIGPKAVEPTALLWEIRKRLAHNQFAEDTKVTLSKVPYR